MEDYDDDVQIIKEINNEKEQITILNHEMRIMCDNISTDVMIIMSNGLGVERIFLNELLAHTSIDKLILVLNTSEIELHYLFTEFCDMEPDVPPRCIVGSSKREKIYNNGGVVFLTAQQLIGDILNEVVNFDKIAGIMIYDCTIVGKSDNLVHSIHRIKAKNHDVWIKAYTDNVRGINFHSSLTSLQAFYDSYKLKKVEFVCRFNEEVKSSLDNPQLMITSYECKLPKEILKIFDTLVEIIIREYNDLLAIASSSYGFEKREDDGPLFCMYKKTGVEFMLKSKSASIEDGHLVLLRNLDNMRVVLRGIVNLDAISLYELIHLLERRNETSNQLRFEDRVWEKRPDFRSIKESIYKLATKLDSFGRPTCYTPVKWTIIEDIVSQVKETIKSRPGHVLVLGSSDDVCIILRQLLKSGRQMLLKHLVSSARDLFDKGNVDLIENIEDDSLWDIDKIKYFCTDYFYNEEKNEIWYIDSLKAIKRKPSKHPSNAPVKKKIRTEGGNDKESQEQFEPYLLVASSNDKFTVLRLLKKYQPRFVISYSPDLSITRMLEVQNALMAKENKTIEYFSIANKEYELQNYQALIHNEGMCFQRLIKQLSSVATSHDDDSFVFHDVELRVARLKCIYANIDLDEEQQTPMVIVDSREFASELPFELGKLGMKLVPQTLEVGDYILSPDTCLERKAIDDLTISLSQGRIFKQCEEMFRYYKNVILLIESGEKFEANRRGADPFKGDLSKFSRDVKLKFCVLLRSYPKLTVLWFMSPKKSAKYLMELKMVNKHDDYMVHDTDGQSACFVKPEMQRVFSKISFLSYKEANSIMNNREISDFNALAALSEESLAKTLSDNVASAKKLYALFNTDFRLIEGVFDP
ncbi:DNA repair endonuclease XPF [Strongyloides ratti]|uniref:DNA repair endonuclease XPF n=1 Tax=Strongyloides ratti TaxID=34506 RepID=A0A090KXX7_STRRB|nr:DNA repair endonuclease XPF [Strongyloides ratti]CEF62375.1 DNA repair endonuclease XPF [Strongyloides ratti]